jgi:hypothetical protein
MQNIGDNYFKLYILVGEYTRKMIVLIHTKKILINGLVDFFIEI